MHGAAVFDRTGLAVPRAADAFFPCGPAGQQVTGGMKPSLTCLSLVFLIGAGANGRAEQPLPRVLLLGDSISMGYTPFVQKALEGKAVVQRPMKDGKPENCSGTTFGVEKIDEWLAMDGGKWDVIHFNFGLHDLKRENKETGKASNDPADPHQAEPEKYRENLKAIVAKLKASGAKLIYATTTPVPEGKMSPHRDPADVVAYNRIALAIMEENGIPVDDLYAAVLPKLAELQQPSNVHFKPAGSEFLAAQVVASLEKALQDSK
jgi:acyl-CoA thioesterase-1